MSTRDGPVARAIRTAADDQRRVLAEIAQAQRATGLSDVDIGRACRMSRWMVARILAGQRRASVMEIAAIGGAVGIDTRLRAYPGDDPIRDAGQQRLLGRFLARLHPSLTARTEVSLPIEGDQRAWDAMVRGTNWWRPAELETVIADVQALERRVALKVRDGQLDGVIIVVADTKRNRRALDAAPAAFAGFSRDARAILGALARGEDPGGSGIVLL